MATSPPPPNPSSGEPSEATSLTAAALAAPARVWESFVAHLPPLPDSGLLAAVSDLHRRHFSVRRRRRRRQRPSMPLPLRPAAAHSSRNLGTCLESCQKLMLRVHNLSTGSISLIYQNLQKLDDFLSSRLLRHKKPNNLTIYWLPYTCGGLGLSVCSLWLLRHSSLMGSSNIDNWIRDAKESMAGFWDEHVEKPIISIRDELFETFKQRDKGIMERQELQLTEDSLHRMLFAFCEQTEGKLPENISEDEMMEMLAKRYEKELMHPIKNLFSGELARAMLIQIQKLKLDLESGLLEMDQILRANAINFAVLAALPAFGLSLLLLVFVRTWALRDHGAEGRGNIARCQRRMLLVDVERRLMEFQHYRDNGMDEGAMREFGFVLYTLDRLCKAVESHAKETGEWLSLREDIFDLAKLDMGMPDKLIVVSRLKWMYNCLLPYSSSRLPRL